MQTYVRSADEAPLSWAEAYAGPAGIAPLFGTGNGLKIQVVELAEELSIKFCSVDVPHLTFTGAETSAMH